MTCRNKSEWYDKVIEWNRNVTQGRMKNIQSDLDLF